MTDRPPRITPINRTAPAPGPGTDRESYARLFSAGTLGGAADPLDRAGDTVVYLSDAMRHILPLVAHYRAAVAELRHCGERTLTDAIDRAEAYAEIDKLMCELPDCLVEVSADIRCARDLVMAATRQLELALS